jgi:hypothetical protein
MRGWSPCSVNGDCSPEQLLGFGILSLLLYRTARCSNGDTATQYRNQCSRGIYELWKRLFSSTAMPRIGEF